MQRKGRNSQNSADAYLQGLTKLQEFLNLNYSGVSINELDSLLVNGSSVSVYELLDSFISYLSASCKLSTNTVSLYVAAVKGYLENCDIEINPAKFKNKVTMPRNHREDEAAIDDSDIRKILLACHTVFAVQCMALQTSGIYSLDIS